jgi:hypothetical protein
MEASPFSLSLFFLLFYLAMIAGVIYFAVRVLEALSNIQRSAQDIANSLRAARGEIK